MKVSQLPLPRLEARQLGPLHILTDDALARTSGVRVAFTGRAGGVSEAPYAGLNLATHVGDDPAAVMRNRALLLEELGVPGLPLIVPNQVHGDELVCVPRADAATLADVREKAARGADGLVVTTSGVAALLCFADCVPVVIASPTGAFAVVHAGWRGVAASIAPKAVRALAARESGAEGPFGTPEEAAAAYNVYLGPHIHVECFETGEDVRVLFAEKMGEECAPDARHVSLARALAVDLVRAGADAARIADAGVCTACCPDEFYSYRAEGGMCGRHGALAFFAGAIKQVRS
ncbi:MULTISPECIES: polyphenol oxidase family protein [unclassified Adlercreutzia]|uniref:polyphenol oxidase family protein n=1 Tax=unclassified Adlercreutzia TaxID=2636013 RepID=UPI0013E9C39E|nr:MULTISPECIES: polyphenol oxidase family protein [unclassified Adlercreutzia]